MDRTGAGPQAGPRVVRKPELRLLSRCTCEDLRATRMVPFDELERDANESVSRFLWRLIA